MNRHLKCTPTASATGAAAAILFVIFLSACGGDDDEPTEPARDLPAASRDVQMGDFRIHFEHDGRGLPSDGNPSVEWQDTAILFDRGLWIGAEVANAPRVSAAAYFGGECAPLALPDSMHVTLVYRLDREASPGDPDFDAWPIGAGAPGVDARPLLFGDLLSWRAYDDRDAARHVLLHSAPLDAEIRETTWWDASAPRVFFVRHEIRNVGSRGWRDAHLGLWADVDLGVPWNDRTACDLSRQLGYVYSDPAAPESVFAATLQPAIGMRLLRIPPGAEFWAFTRQWKNVDEPATAAEAMRCLRGLLPNGSAMIDSSSGEPTRFWASGDPVSGEGQVEHQWLDRRVLMSIGPLQVDRGESITLIHAVVFALAGSSTDAILELRARSDAIANTPSLWDIPD